MVASLDIMITMATGLWLVDTFDELRHSPALSIGLSVFVWWNAPPESQIIYYYFLSGNDKGLRIIGLYFAFEWSLFGIEWIQSGRHVSHDYMDTAVISKGGSMCVCVWGSYLCGCVGMNEWMSGLLWIINAWYTNAFVDNAADGDDDTAVIYSMCLRNQCSTSLAAGSHTKVRGCLHEMVFWHNRC